MCSANTAGLGNSSEGYKYTANVPNLAADGFNPTPTATPTAIPTPVPWPEFSSSSLEFYASQAGWPEHLWGQLRVVVQCESRYNPFARNPSGASGLLQIKPMWFAYAGVPYEEWSNPLTNLYVGYQVYLYDIRVGNVPWAQWAACRP